MKSLLKKLLYAGLPVPAFLRPLIRGLYRLGVWCVEAFGLVLKLLWVEPVLRSVCRSCGKKLRAERLPYMRGEGDLTLGDRVNLSGRSCFYFMSGMEERPGIAIGNSTFIGHGCTLSCAQRITVGEHCLISAGVRIHDNDGHPLDPERRRNGDPIRPDEAAQVSIGDNVWIGAEAMIMKGVSIGANSVIGTASIVTDDIPPNCVAAGSPARVIRGLGTGSQSPVPSP